MFLCSDETEPARNGLSSGRYQDVLSWDAEKNYELRFYFDIGILIEVIVKSRQMDGGMFETINANREL